MGCGDVCVQLIRHSNQMNASLRSLTLKRYSAEQMQRAKVVWDSSQDFAIDPLSASQLPLLMKC